MPLRLLLSMSTSANIMSRIFTGAASARGAEHATQGAAHAVLGCSVEASEVQCGIRCAASSAHLPAKIAFTSHERYLIAILLRILRQLVGNVFVPPLPSIATNLQRLSPPSLIGRVQWRGSCPYHLAACALSFVSTICQRVTNVKLGHCKAPVPPQGGRVARLLLRPLQHHHHGRNSLPRPH